MIEPWHTFALHRPREREEPAQLWTSVAKRLGSEGSCGKISLARSVLVHLMAHNVMTVDPDNKVKPWLYGQIWVGITEDLEAE